MKKKVVLTAIVIGIGLGGCTWLGKGDKIDEEMISTEPSNEVIPPEKTVAQVLEDKGQSEFNKAVALIGVHFMLDTEGSFTILAPTDEALKEAGIDPERMFNQNPESLVELVNNHIIPGRLVKAELEKYLEVGTYNQRLHKIEKREGEIFVDRAKIVEADVESKDDLVQIIDRVLEAN